MRGTVTRIRRKLRSDGIPITIRSIWKEIYLIEILTNSPRVRTYMHHTIDPVEVDREIHKINQLPRQKTFEIEIPDKIWVSGDFPIEDVETYSIAVPSLHKYKNCHYIVPPGLGVAEGKKVIPDTIASELGWKRGRNQTFISRLVYEHGYRIIRRFFDEDQPIDEFDFERVFPLYPFWKNYYHWTAECLPKLLWLDEDHIENSEDVTIVIPADSPNWMTQSLEILGFDDYTGLEKGRFTAKELIVPSGPEPSPEECRWFRDQAHSGIDMPDDQSNRIYVSREKANRRRVANRDELLEMLLEFGFESYVLEDLSVTEQAKLFANAEIVVGPHGAGLTNLMYSQETAVIELFGSRKKMTYYRLSKLLGFEYRAIIGEEMPPDIKVDLEDVRDNLNHLISESDQSG